MQDEPFVAYLQLPCRTKVFRAIEERDVDTADLLGKAHGDQIVYQIRKLIAEDRRDQLDL